MRAAPTATTARPGRRLASTTSCLCMGSSRPCGSWRSRWATRAGRQWAAAVRAMVPPPRGCGWAAQRLLLARRHHGASAWTSSSSRDQSHRHRQCCWAAPQEDGALPPRRASALGARHAAPCGKAPATGPLAPTPAPLALGSSSSSSTPRSTGPSTVAGLMGLAAARSPCCRGRPEAPARAAPRSCCRAGRWCRVSTSGASGRSARHW